MTLPSLPPSPIPRSAMPGRLLPLPLCHLGDFLEFWLYGGSSVHLVLFQDYKTHSPQNAFPKGSVIEMWETVPSSNWGREGGRGGLGILECKSEREREREIMYIYLY